MMRWAWLLLLVTAPVQERPSAAEIVERMEKTASASRGFALEFAASTDYGYLQVGGTVAELIEASASAGGEVRVRSRTEAGVDPDVQEYYGLRHFPEAVETLTADAITLSCDWGGSRSLLLPYRIWTERIRPGGRIHGGGANTLFSMGPSGHETAGFLFHLLSPKRAFAYDPDLEVEGRRRIAGRDCLVLRSLRKLRDPARKVRGQEDWSGGGTPHTIISRWFVDAADQRLRRMTQQYVSEQPYANFRISWTAAAGADGRPASFTLTVDSPIYDDYESRITFTAKAAKPGTVPPIRPAEDFFAAEPAGADGNAPAPAEPKDAAADYAWVLAHLAGRQQEMFGVLRPGAAKAPDHAEAEAVLERILKTAWAPSPLRNLVHLYALDGAADKLSALVDRIEKEKGGDPTVAAEAASALVAVGRHKRAVPMLEAMDDAPRSGAGEALVLGRLGLGDAAKAAAAFERLADPRRVERFWPSLTEDAMKGVKAEDFLAGLDAAVAARPASPGLHAARMLALAHGEDFPRFADAARAALLQAPGEALSRFTIRLLRVRLKSAAGDAQNPVMVLQAPGAPGALPKLDADKLKAGMKNLLAAYDAAGTSAAAVAGRALARKFDGEREAALADYAAAIEAAAKLPPEDLQGVAGDVALELDGYGDDALLEKACLVLMRSVQADGFRRPVATMMMGDGANPLSVYARYCHRTKNYAPLFHALKRFRSSEVRQIFSWMPNLGEIDFKEFFAAARKEVERDPADAAGLVWLASAASLENTGWNEEFKLDPVEFLEPARQRLPEDPQVLQSLVRAYERRSDLEKAGAAAEDLFKLLEKNGGTAAGEWTLSAVLLSRARDLRLSRQEEAAAATLAKIDPASMEVPAWVAWAASKLLEDLGKADRAAEVLGWAEREGYRPYLRMAELHQKRKDWSATMRSLNRAIARGSEIQIDPPQSMFGGAVAWQEMDSGEEKTVPDPARLKTDLYKQIGDTYFIDRLVASPLPPLAAGDEKRAREGLAKLSSEEMVEREEAYDALRRIGPSCAPILREGLSSTDEEVRTRVRRMLMDWAEPK